MLHGTTGVLKQQILLCSGLLLPPVKEKKEEKKSKFVRKLTGRKTEKYKPQPSRESGLAGLLENIRTQMEVGYQIKRTLVLSFMDKNMNDHISLL